MINIAKTSLVVAVSLILMSGCSSESSGSTSSEGKSSASSSGAQSIKKSNLVLDLNKKIDERKIELYVQKNDFEYKSEYEPYLETFFSERYKEIENIKDVVDKEEAVKKAIEDLKKLREEFSLEGAKAVFKHKSSFSYKDGKIEAAYLFSPYSHVSDIKIEPSSKEDLKKLANEGEGYVQLSGTLHFIKADESTHFWFIPRWTDTHIEVFDKDGNKINTAKISYTFQSKKADLSHDSQEIVQ